MDKKYVKHKGVDLIFHVLKSNVSWKKKIAYSSYMVIFAFLRVCYTNCTQLYAFSPLVSA